MESVVITGMSESAESEEREESAQSAPDNPDAAQVVMSTDPAVMQEAAAQFQIADANFAQSTPLTIQVGQPASLEDYIQALGNQIRVSSDRTRVLSDVYEAVLDLRNAHWSVAALVQQGRVYESLVDAIRNAPLPSVLPVAVQQQLQGQQLNAAAQARLQGQVATTVREFLEGQTRLIECVALVRFVKAVRMARVGEVMINRPYTTVALAHLRRFSAPILEECITSTQASDPMLTNYVPGEFSL